jgi:hypothetical protein
MKYKILLMKVTLLQFHIITMDHIIINIRDLANLLLQHDQTDKDWIAQNANYIMGMCKRASMNTSFTVRFIFDTSTPESSVQKFVKCWGDLLEVIKTKHQGFHLTWEREVKSIGYLFWKSESVEYVLSVRWDGAV